MFLGLVTQIIGIPGRVNPANTGGMNSVSLNPFDTDNDIAFLTSGDTYTGLNSFKRGNDPDNTRGIALREVPLESGGRDCLLLVDRVPFGVIEAKKEGTTLSTVSAQSELQGESLPDSLAHLLPGTKQRPLALDILADSMTLRTPSMSVAMGFSAKTCLPASKA